MEEEKVTKIRQHFSRDLKQYNINNNLISGVSQGEGKVERLSER